MPPFIPAFAGMNGGLCAVGDFVASALSAAESIEPLLLLVAQRCVALSERRGLFAEHVMDTLGAPRRRAEWPIPVPARNHRLGVAGSAHRARTDVTNISPRRVSACTPLGSRSRD